MENITKYSDYELNESTIEIEDSEEGVYVLTLHDIHNIVNEFTDEEVDEDTILAELEDYKFVKVEDSEITKDDDEDHDDDDEDDEDHDDDDEDHDDDDDDDDDDVQEIDELSSDDENPSFIKKFEME